MDYIPPRNYPATVGNPRPSYPDGDKPAGVKGAIPSGKAFEHPMREILFCIEQAGKTPDGNKLTQLWESILWAVAQGGGSGSTAPTLDFTKMPVMPEVVTNAGYLGVASSVGQVAVADGGTFVHRGGNQFQTATPAVAARTFTTFASKTYHLRWRFNGGAPAYALKDLADGTYNPGGLAEAHQSFDTTFDDMLIARVVTNSSNVPTVTGLANLSNLSRAEILFGTDIKRANTNGTNFLIGTTLNWARRPTTYTLSPARAWCSSDDDGDRDFNIFALGPDRNSDAAVNAASPAIPVDRYGLSCVVNFDRAKELAMQWAARA